MPVSCGFLSVPENGMNSHLVFKLSNIGQVSTPVACLILHVQSPSSGSHPSATMPGTCKLAVPRAQPLRIGGLLYISNQVISNDTLLVCEVRLQSTGYL